MSQNCVTTRVRIYYYPRRSAGRGRGGGGGNGERASERESEREGGRERRERGSRAVKRGTTCVFSRESGNNYPETDGRANPKVNRRRKKKWEERVARVDNRPVIFALGDVARSRHA